MTNGRQGFWRTKKQDFLRQNLLSRKEPEGDVFSVTFSSATSTHLIFAEHNTGRVMANYWYELRLDVAMDRLESFNLHECSEKIIQCLGGKFERDLNSLKEQIETDESLQVRDAFSFNVVVSVILNNTHLESFKSHPALQTVSSVFGRLDLMDTGRVQMELGEMKVDDTGLLSSEADEVALSLPEAADSDISSETSLESLQNRIVSTARKNELIVFCKNHKASLDFFSEWESASEKCRTALRQVCDLTVRKLEEIVKEPLLPQFGKSCS